jgi:surface protein
MNYLFDGCKSLKSLPDISKWNTEKLEDIRNMFVGCSLLKEYQDI